MGDTVEERCKGDSAVVCQQGIWGEQKYKLYGISHMRYLKRAFFQVISWNLQLKKKKIHWGWEDNLVGQVFATQPWGGLHSIPRTHIKTQLSGL